MKTLNFGGQVLEYKSSHRALREYEKLIGKPASEINTHTDSTNLIYCIVKTVVLRAGLKFEMSVDEFIEWLDENPKAIEGLDAEVKEDPSGDEKKS